MSPKRPLSVLNIGNASSTRAKRNDTRSSVRLCWIWTVGRSFARFLARDDDTTSSCIKPLECALPLKLKVYSDIGYQGIQKLHLNTRLPHKKPRGGQLTQQQRADNRALARRRVVIEQTNRCLKIFRILAERYRNRRRRFGLRCNLIAAVYNYECALTV